MGQQYHLDFSSGTKKKKKSWLYRGENYEMCMSIDEKSVQRVYVRQETVTQDKKFLPMLLSSMELWNTHCDELKAFIPVEIPH